MAKRLLHLAGTLTAVCSIVLLTESPAAADPAVPPAHTCSIFDC